MGPRKRRKVEEGTGQLQYNLPVPKSSGDTSSSTTINISKEEFVSQLEDAKKDKLSDLVLDCLKKDRSKLAKLKAKLSNVSSVARGTYTPMDTRFEKAGKTVAYISQFNVIPLIIWREVIVNNFDNVAEIKTNDLQDSTDESTGDDKETLMRAFVAPLHVLFREDLPNYMRQTFLDSVKRLQNEVSDYLLPFSMVVETMMLLFVQSGTKSGQKFEDIIPKEFIDESFLRKLIIPRPNQPTDNTKNDTDWLFTESHLKYIHSCNFSTSKPRSDMKEKHPVWHSLQEKLERTASLQQKYYRYLNTMLSTNSQPTEDYVE